MEESMKRILLKEATRRFAAILAFVLLAVGTVASAAVDSFELHPRWKKGERVRFEMTKSREKARLDKLIFKTTTRTEVEVEVLTATEDAFVLAWTLGETKFDDTNETQNVLVQKMANLLKGHRMVLELDSQAGIQSVQNWRELKAASTKRLEILSTELKAAGIDPAT